jgi:hypothetical protein
MLIKNSIRSAIGEADIVAAAGISASKSLKTSFWLSREGWACRK